MNPRVATMTGTFLTPGVSKNGRLYTREHIARATERLTQRLESGDGLPVTMLSHHGANDDSTQIAGGLRRVWVAPDGTGQFEADIPDTTVGRDIAALTHGDKPYLGSVSIRGAWLGKIRKESAEGHAKPVETADDIDIDGIDFTKIPGVSGARIKSVTLAQATAAHSLPAESHSRTPIVESVQVSVEAEPETCVHCGRSDPPTTEAPESAPTPKETPVAETTPAAPAAPEATEAEAAPARNLTDADVQALAAGIAAAIKPAPVATAPAESAPTTTTTTTTEAAAPAESVQESITKAIGEMRESLKAEIRESMVKEHGLPSRRGLVPGVTEGAAPTKPLHEMDADEFRAYQASTVSDVFGLPPA